MALTDHILKNPNAKGALIWGWDSIRNQLLTELEQTYKREAAKIASKASSDAPGSIGGDISWEVVRDDRTGRVKGYVGLRQGAGSAAYARRIEFGFNWTSNKLRDDSLGRTPIQEPNSFLRSNLQASRGEIMRAIRVVGTKISKARAKYETVKAIA